MQYDEKSTKFDRAVISAAGTREDLNGYMRLNSKIQRYQAGAGAVINAAAKRV